MRIHTAVCLLSFLSAGLTGCATSTDRDPGHRVLDAIVVGRGFEASGAARSDPGRFDNSSEDSGNWYLVFEASDGEAQAHYRLHVTRQQYMMFQEGTDVQITLVGYELRALRQRP